MSRRPCITVSMLLLLAVAAPASMAWASTDWSLRLGGGLSEPTGDFGLQWGTGGPLSAFLGAGVTPRLQIGADVAYQTRDEQLGVSILHTIFHEEADLTMWRVGARAQYQLNDPGSRWVPLLLAGVALHPTTIDLRESDGTHQEFKDTGFGVSGGAGIGYRLGSQWVVGLESVYYWVKSNESEMQQSTMPHLDFNFGLQWTLGGGKQ